MRRWNYDAFMAVAIMLLAVGIIVGSFVCPKMTLWFTRIMSLALFVVGGAALIFTLKINNDE